MIRTPSQAGAHAFDRKRAAARRSAAIPRNQEEMSSSEGKSTTSPTALCKNEVGPLPIHLVSVAKSFASMAASDE